VRIDIHTHFQCLDFLKHLQGRSNLPKGVLDGGTYVIQCATGLDLPALPKIIDMEQKLRDMEDMKVNVAALSHGIPFGPEVLGGREADEWAMIPVALSPKAVPIPSAPMIGGVVNFRPVASSDASAHHHVPRSDIQRRGGDEGQS